MKTIVKIHLLLLAAAVIAACTDDKEMTYSVNPDLSPTSIATGDVSGVSYASATIQGSASMNEGVVSRGVFLDTLADFSTAQVVPATVVDSVTGNYTVQLTQLTPLTKYYVKAYATSFAGGTILGTVKDFTTLNAPPLWESYEGTYASALFVGSFAVTFDKSLVDVDPVRYILKDFFTNPIVIEVSFSTGTAVIQAQDLGDDIFDVGTTTWIRCNAGTYANGIITFGGNTWDNAFFTDGTFASGARMSNERFILPAGAY
jgi:hypothetical protein